METETEYELQHRSGGKTGRWWRTKTVTDPEEAHAELTRMRALAVALATGAEYRCVRQVRTVLSW
jgi:hypothetical protein